MEVDVVDIKNTPEKKKTLKQFTIDPIMDLPLESPDEKLVEFMNRLILQRKNAKAELLAANQ